MIDQKTVRRFLGVNRAVVGLWSWLAPSTALKVFGLGRAGEDTYVTRLFGARDLLLGAMLLATAGTARDTITDTGIACDTLDVLSGLDELRRGRLGLHGLVASTGGAALFAGLGLWLRDQAGKAPTGI